MNAPASGLDIEVDDIFGIDVPGREIIGKDLVCIAGRTAAGDHSFDGSLLIQGEHAPDVAGEGYDLSPAGRSGVAVFVFVNFFSEIGREHVCTPVTHALIVCRLTIEQKQISTTTYNTT